MNSNRNAKLFTAFMLGLILLLLFTGTALAQDVEPFPSDDDVNSIAKQMYCPVCENIPLDVCETKACEQWRELIREKLAEGWTEEQIKDYFVLQYGDRVLAEPPRRGLNWLVYILPLAAFLIGAFILILVLLRMRKPAAVPTTADLEADGEIETYRARMEEALKERKKRNE